MAVTSLADRLRAQIEADGPISVSTFIDAALYDPAEGFYATGGHAGRRGDFLTAPEVGPLFGAVVSNAIDSWWRAAGEPEQFVVAEHGAGPGTLARTVTVAAGDCLSAGALRWVMVERSDAQRLQHPEGAHLASVSSDAELEHVDVVFANELLDNIAFDVVERTGDGWIEVRVDVDGDSFGLVGGAAVDAPPGAADAPIGSRLPSVAPALVWISDQRARHPSAHLVALDYAATTAELVARDGEWLRAYREHTRLTDWLSEPGTCDITIDLPIEQLQEVDGAVVTSQADFLRTHGIDELVAEGQRLWEASAHIGDLAALRARSRATEAGALLDPAGMGGFSVFEW